MIISSVQSLSQHPTSRVIRENFDVLCRFWQDEVNGFSVLVKEIQETNAGRAEKTVYLSLPRPGKHGTTSKGKRQSALFISRTRILDFSRL